MKLTVRPAIVAIGCLGLALAGCDALTSVETRISRAEASLEAGDYDQAVAEAKKALEKAPEDARARLLLARAAVALGDADTTLAEADRLAQAGADPVGVARVRVEALILRGQIDEAAAQLAVAAEMPAGERALLAGRIALARGDGLAAVSAFDQALKTAPDSLEARVGKLAALLAQGLNAEARSGLDTFLAAHPAYGRGWLLKARLEFSEGHFGEAAEDFLTASRNAAALTQPERVQALVGRVESLLVDGKVEDAAKAFAVLQEGTGASPIVLLTGARVALAQGDARAAVESLQRVVQVLPGRSAPRALLVEAQLRQGNTEQALAEAGRLLGDFPDSDVARLTLANAQAQTGRLREAEATLEPLIDRDQPSLEALAMAAQLRLREGRAEAGLDLLERGLELRPDDPRLRLEMATAYLSAGQTGPAIEILRGIADGPDGLKRDRLLVIATVMSRDPRAARAELDRALAANPGDVDLLVMAAGYHAALPDLPQARRYIERSLEVQPGNASALLAAARLDLREGKVDEAERRARAVLQVSPTNLQGLGVMAEVARARGHQEEVERWLQEARRADASAVPPRLLLMRSALRRGEDTKFGELVAEVEKTRPDDARMQLAVGDVLAEAGRREQAMQRYQRAAELDPRLPNVWLGMALLHAAQGNLGLARRTLQRALEVSPGWFPAASALARLEASQGMADQALRIVADQKQRLPQGPQSWTLEGDVRAALGQPAAAARAYEEALARGGDGGVAARAMRARRAAGLTPPEAPLTRWLERSPGDVIARRTLAMFYLEMGRRAESIAEYEKVVAAASDDAISLNNLAWLYHEAKDPKAREMARRAYELSPQSASIADTYGWILVEEGDAAEGLAVLREVAPKAERNGTIQYHYGYALNAVGEREEARIVLRKALEASAPFAERGKAEALLRGLGG